MPITGLEDDIRRIAVDTLDAAGNAIMADLIEAAPVGTGELRDSAYGPTLDDRELTVTVGFDAPQADFTNLGTQPHRIDGNPLLRFFWADGPNGPGDYTFTSVDHPGVEGTGWFDDVIDNWQDYVDDAASDVP